MKFTIIVVLLAAATMAASEFKTPTTAAAHAPPICSFDAVKGEYICPEGEGRRISTVQLDNTTRSVIKNTKIIAPEADSIPEATVAAADCPKCQADWEKCLTHWGCWFYDCKPACRYQVANNDLQCEECPAGECHAKDARQAE